MIAPNEKQRFARVAFDVALRKTPRGLEFEFRHRWEMLVSRDQLVADALELRPELAKDEVAATIDRWLADGVAP